MSGADFGRFILGLIVVAIVVAIVVWLLHWLYLRSSKERAFVRTGLKKGLQVEAERGRYPAGDGALAGAAGAVDGEDGDEHGGRAGRAGRGGRKRQAAVSRTLPTRLKSTCCLACQRS